MGGRSGLGSSLGTGRSTVDYEIRRIERDRDGAVKEEEVVYYDGDYETPSRVPSK